MSSYRMKYKIGLVEHSVVVPEDIPSPVPVGTIFPYASNSLTLPAGFLLCDGSAVSRTMFPDLFAVIGTLYGAGDGSTTFNLPNLLNRFIEGANSAGTDISAGLPNIYGEFNSYVDVTDSVIGKTYPYKDAIGVKNNWITRYNTCVDSTRSLWQADHVYINASRSSSVYGNSSTVQPPALTMRYIIKAFSNASADSALVDISNVSSELTQKYDIRSDMTIIYPNNGTAANPANVSVNTRYVEDNPFPGYLVYCQAEVYNNNTSEWGVAGWYESYDNSIQTVAGCVANQHNSDKIVVQTGRHYLLFSGYLSGSSFGMITSGNPASIPCRVKVWKIGKI